MRDSALTGMAYIFLSHSYFDGGVKVGSHHLSEHLANAQGKNCVVHVSTPVSVLQARATRETSSSRYLASSKPSLDRSRVVDVVPRQLLPSKLYVSGRWVKEVCKQVNLSEPERAVIFVDQPLFYRSIGRLVEGVSVPSKVVYRPTDIHPKGALAAAEKKITKIADAIVATSGHTLRTVKTQNNCAPDFPSFILENGVELENFSAKVPTSQRHGFIYVGAIDGRFDWQSILRIAQKHSTERITLVGPARGGVPPLPKNVQLRGAVPYAEIAGLLLDHKVGLLPFNASTLNDGRSPMKFYEYLASGLAVAGTSTTELSARNAPNTFLWNDIEEAAEQAGNALVEGRPALGIKHAELFDWSLRTKDLTKIAQALFHSEPGETIGK